MKKIGFTLLLGGILSIAVWGQKKLTEGTIYYDVVINTNNDKPSAAAMMDGATNVVYLKGNSSRSDLISSLGTQSTIIDGKTGAVTILKDYGDQKYMINLTANDWKNRNKKYDNVTYTIENEFKTIATYNCQKAIGKLSDGTTFTVYFTKDLVPVNNEFQYINKNLPGLAMEYEAAQGSTKVIYTVSSIDFGAVPMSKFDLPESGYRVVPYTGENKKEE
ncbi:hypothetical protein A8C56_04685 [Niabella ginsenosidivorans]|uniref:DUF4412 domain-containing protein n=1 Tax=Niabella ginsenosidivorans TaxID=1176587 RepID=A0A1A9I0X5_9BACT|nr:hypothetical protein [Niabella ginsenosidivorans]ANH80370.1 hypothetical protein A8C56_04685 [Niabella ginsenosidivorans]